MKTPLISAPVIMLVASLLSPAASAGILANGAVALRGAAVVPAGAAVTPDGVVVTPPSAFDVLSAKAAAGDPAAQLSLGEMYSSGDAVPVNKAESARLFRLAADAGNAKAAFLLGFMYEVGDGVPKYKVEAAQWYQIAAEGGNARAQYILGSMYSRGDGVQQDYAEAGKWLSRAAEQGHAQAQALLIRNYNSGEDVFASRAGAAEVVLTQRGSPRQLVRPVSAWHDVQRGRRSREERRRGPGMDQSQRLERQPRLREGARIAWRTTWVQRHCPPRGRERSREILVQVAKVVVAATKDSPITAQSGI